MAKVAAADSKVGAGVQRKIAKKVVNAVAKLKLSKEKKMATVAAVVERANTRSRAVTSTKAPAASKMKSSVAKVKQA